MIVTNDCLERVDYADKRIYVRRGVKGEYWQQLYQEEKAARRKYATDRAYQSAIYAMEVDGIWRLFLREGFQIVEQS